MSDVLIDIGLVVFTISILSLIVGLGLVILSIWEVGLRKAARYTLLGSGICMLLSFGLCSAGII